MKLKDLMMLDPIKLDRLRYMEIDGDNSSVF